MFKYRTLSIVGNAINPSCDIKVYIEELRNCVKNKKRSTAKLLEYSQPYLDSWEYMLTTPGSIKNINYVSFCGALASRTQQEASIVINHWVSFTKQTMTIKEQLIYLFLNAIDQVRWITYQNYDYLSVRIVDMYFKGLLKVDMRKAWLKPLDDQFEELTFNEKAYEPEYPDFMLLQHLEEHPWQYYLVSLARMQMERGPRSLLVFMSQKQLNREEQELWTILKNDSSTTDQ